MPGPILGAVGYSGLNLAMLPLIAAVAIAVVLATRRRETQPA